MKPVIKRKYNKELFVLLTAIFSLFFLPAHCQINYEINKIKFKGNNTFGKKELMKNISIYEINFLERLLKRKEPSFYNEILVQADVERLIRFYQSQGFLYVQLKLLPPEIDDKKHRVNLTFDIQEKKPVLVDSVSFSIASSSLKIDKDSILKRIRRRMELKEKKRFTDEKLSLDMNRINSRFRRSGFAYVETDYNLDLHSKDLNTDVNYNINPGPRTIIDTTLVTGNKYVSSNFIKKQLAYKKGEYFNEKKFDDSRRLLYDLQLFRIVSIAPQTNEITKDSIIPVNISITEQPRLSTEFGVGYGTEEKFRTYARATYRSFFGDARRLVLYAKHSAIEPYNVSLSFIEPRFFHKQLSLTISPYFKRQIEPAYDTKTLGITTPLNYKFNERLNATLTYYYERVWQNISDTVTDIPVVDYTQKFLYNKSGVMGAFSYTTAYPQFSPRRGVSLGIGAKFNGYFFGGDFSYTKLWFDARKYQYLGNSFVLALRGMVGGIQSKETDGFVPVEDRFYSGGSNSIRGWGRSMLGPYWEENGKPKGGKSIVEMSAEIRRPLFWIIDGAVFLDAGNVWEQSYYYRFNDLAYAVGVGIRFETPIGPIRLDLGMPIKNTKKTPQFFINVGQAF